MRTSRSFDLFPQHRIMPTFASEKYAMEVNDKPREATKKLNKKNRAKVLNVLIKLCKDAKGTEDGERQLKRMEVSPHVTITTRPTSPANVVLKLRTHQKQTREATKKKKTCLSQGIIEQDSTVTTTPNSNKIPCFFPNIKIQETLNTVTDRAWDTTADIWTPADVLTGNVTECSNIKNAQKVDIEQFCAAAIHPDTGETISSSYYWLSCP